MKAIKSIDKWTTNGHLTQTCVACAATLPVDDFYPNRSSKRGTYNKCKLCVRKDTQRYRSENPERTAYLGRRSKLARYGITPEQYDEMHAQQNGLCAICFLPSEVVSLSVDHCHTTGKVRGLLCRPCNSAIALLAESEERMLSAIAYIKATSQ